MRSTRTRGAAEGARGLGGQPIRQDSDLDPNIVQFDSLRTRVSKTNAASWGGRCPRHLNQGRLTHEAVRFERRRRTGADRNLDRLPRARGAAPRFDRRDERASSTSHGAAMGEGTMTPARIRVDALIVRDMSSPGASTFQSRYESELSRGRFSC